MGLLFKMLFSRKYKNLKASLLEVKSYNVPSKDSFINSLMLFAHLFYLRGFLGATQMPAFPNAYKNISTDIFKKTYIALPLYFALHRGVQDSSFTTYDELLQGISEKYPTLDLTILNRLSLEWKEITQDELDQRLYQHFRDYGIFRKVFSASDSEVEAWFKNFLSQTYTYVTNNIGIK